MNEDKAGLREHFRSQRKNLQKNAAKFSTASVQVNRNLTTLLQEIIGPKHITLAYMAYGSEVPVDQQDHFAYPRLDSDFKLRFFKFKDSATFETNEFGIREPIADSDLEVASRHLDQAVALIPALAFDRAGNRLGSGKGYYDRFLSTFPQVQKVGVSFDIQVSDHELPASSWDIPMDWLVTESRVLRFKRKG